jgi:hypothetical protein
MSDRSSSSSSGIGLGGLIFLLFLALKLTRVIDWSWWWITAPLWIPAGIIVIVLIIAGIIVIFKD